MINITKVSSRIYKVFAIDNDSSCLLYTIKRVNPDKYVVRSLHDDTITFSSLKDAKAFVRVEKKHEDLNWLDFFVKHTKGRTFKNQEESNNHMKLLSVRWKQ